MKTDFIVEKLKPLVKLSVNSVDIPLISMGMVTENNILSGFRHKLIDFLLIWMNSMSNGFCAGLPFARNAGPVLQE